MTAKLSSAEGFATGVPQVYEKNGGWYVALFTGDGLHRVGPTTKEKAEAICSDAIKAMWLGDSIEKDGTK